MTKHDTGLAVPRGLRLVLTVCAVTVGTLRGATLSAQAPGLVAAYSFDEGSGTTANDESGTGNPGTISGASWTPSGHFGAALTFDGVDDWVTVPDADTLDLTTAMTLQAWVYPTALGGWRTVLLKETSNELAYALYAHDNASRPATYVNSGGSFSADGSQAFPLDAWTHLAATYDGAVLRLFVNGAEVGNQTVNGGVATSGQALRVGGNSVWGEYFSGRIDEVRIYNRALTPLEIQTDMNTPLGVPPGPQLVITQPVDNATVNGTTVDVTYTSTGDLVGAGVDHVYFRLDGGPEVMDIPMDGIYQFTGVATGVHILDGYLARSDHSKIDGTDAVPINFAVVIPDTNPPIVDLTAPLDGDVVSAVVPVSANATDDVGVVGVQFLLDGAPLGPEDIVAPHTYDWHTATAANGPHTLSALARDAAGNATVAASITVTVSNVQTAAPGLVAAYSLDEGAGLDAGDASGTGNTGTISGATWTTSGYFGNALSFDGANDWVTVPDAISLDLTTGMTLEAWVHPTVLSSWRTVVLKERPNDLAYALYAHDNAPRPSAYINGGLSASGSQALPLNTWTHLAVTYDGAVLRLFVNGREVGNQSVGSGINTSSQPLRIGGNSVWGEYFAGRIDEVRVYDQPLTASQVQSDMITPITPITPVAEAPLNLAAAAGDGQLSLTWSASAGADSYNVKRATTTGGPYTTIATGITATSHVDAGLANGVSFYYVVSAVNAGGESGDSAEASATTLSPPVINSLTSSANPAPVQASVTFTLTAQDSDNEPLLYSFDFGDGTPRTVDSSIGSGAHSYTAPGRYTVQGFVKDGTYEVTTNLVQIAHLPLTATRPTASAQITYDDIRGKVWNVNPDSDTVTRIDGPSLSRDFETPVGNEPRTLALHPGGSEVWVASEGSHQLHVLDASTGNVLAALATPRGARPMGVAFSPDAAAVYVTYLDLGVLAKWDPVSRTEVATLNVGPTPRALAISADSSRIFVGRFIAGIQDGQVYEVSATTFTLTRTFTLAHDDTPDSPFLGRGTPNYIVQMSIAPDGQRLWVPSKKDNTDRGTFLDGFPLTQDNTVRSIFSKLDLVNNVEDTLARTDVDDHELPHGVCFSPTGDLAFVAYQGNNSVRVFNAYDNSPIVNLSVGTERAPQDLVVTPDGSRLFILNFMTRSVTAFDISALVAGTSSSATELGVVSAVTTELLAPDVLLGKQVFYNAADTRMTAQGYLSCATCHLDGGHDGRVFDFTDRGEGLRNTISLVGGAGTGHGNVHWTGNFDEIQDFELDIVNSFGGLGFMTDGPPNPSLGAPNAGRSVELDALAAYVSSLLGHGQSPHRNNDGTLSTDGVAGKQLFQNLDCASCHAGANFTDSAVGTTGNLLHDVGTLKPSSGQRLGGPLLGLDTPSLRGLWRTPPYLHDGAAASLLDVITSQNPGDLHGVTSTLISTDQAQLVAYLLQIDDDEPAATPVAPAALTALAANAEVALAWSAPPGADTYVVKRALTAGGPYSILASGVPTTSHADSGITNGTTYYYVVSALNPGGESFDSIEVSALPEAASIPVLVLTQPTNNSTINGATVDVTYTTIGDLVAAGVSHVHFHLDGDPAVIDNPMDGIYQFTGVTAGVHLLGGYLVRADQSKIDGTDAVPVNFTVVIPDTTPPTIVVTDPLAGATVSGPATVAADATDDVGVAGVQFTLNGLDLGIRVTTSPYSLSWDTTTISDGRHSLGSVATDLSGNSTLATPITVTVDNATVQAVVGSWSAPVDIGMVAVNMVLLHTGKILMYRGEDQGGDSATVWDPISNVSTPVPNPFTNIFCSGHAALADGRILVVGGHDTNIALGDDDANIFDPVTETWTSVPPMASRRWYSTATTLGDGRVLVTSGAINCFTCIAEIPEIYDPVTNSWTQLTGAALAVPYYPFMFLLPDGRVVDVGSSENPVETYSLDTASETWTLIDPVVQDGGSAAMYRLGKILKTGTSATTDINNLPAASAAYVIDMNEPAPAWRQVASMEFPRAYHNTTILPDGDILVTSGGNSTEGKNVGAAVLAAELWSPVTESWQTMEAMSVPRIYHSTALLLPDGRVVVAGSGDSFGGPNQFTAEFFSPPYLFNGPRPVVTSMPGVLDYGVQFGVQTADAANIASVALMRPGANTHQFDHDQRYLDLTFTPGAGVLTVDSPAHPNLAPPGYYMVFLVDTNGVPSVAPVVQLQLPPADTQPPPPPGNLTAVGSVGTITLSWIASVDDTAVAKYNVHRSTSLGFTPSVGNRVAESTSTSYVDAGLPFGQYYYQVTAEDVSGNISAPSNEATAVAQVDSIAPTVDLTSPTDGDTVSGSITITAQASDDVGVAGVQFTLNGANLGPEDGSAPYLHSWNTLTVADGAHALTAIARDAAGNLTESLAVVVTVSNAQAGPPGLVAAFGFDEGTGTEAGDASGIGNTGAVSGAAWTTGGYFGGALSFDGAGDWVTVTDSSSLDLTTGMTLEAWVYPTAQGSWRTVVLKETPNELSYALYANDNAPRPGAYLGVGGSTSVQGSQSLPLNTWTHLAATYDNATLRIYFNGNEVGVQVATGGISTSSGALRIGGNAVWGEYFAGLIDEVRIYDQPLTASEIQTDMNAPVAGFLGPRLVITQPVDNSTVLGTTVDITYTTTGDLTGAGVDHVHFRLDGGPDLVDLPPMDGIFQLTGVTLGVHLLEGFLVEADQTKIDGTDADPITFTVAIPDTVSPTVDLTSPLNGDEVSAVTALSADATDDVGVAGVQFLVGGAPLGAEVLLAPYTYDWNTAAVANGSYDLSARARDAAGNQTDSLIATVTVFNTQTTLPGLVAAFGFEGGSGTNVGDASGNGNAGTISGAIWTTTGYFGNALDFDGANDWVTVVDSSSLDLAAGMTLEAWVFPTALGGWRTVLMKETSNELAYALYAHDNAPRPAAYVNPGGSNVVRGSQALPLNAWTHLAVTYDGAAVRLYVDGTEVDSQPLTGTITGTSRPLRIGGNSVWGEYFNGLIDEVRVYDRALSPAELVVDMGTPVGG